MELDYGSLDPKLKYDNYMLLAHTVKQELLLHKQIIKECCPWC